MVKIGKIFLLICLFFSAEAVFASTDIEFNCPTEAMVGNTVSCEVKLNSDKKILGLIAKYEYDNVLTYNTSSTKPNSAGLVNNNLGFAMVDVDGINNNENIQEIKFIVSNSAIGNNVYKIKLKDIQASDGEEDINIEDKEVELKILSSKEVIDFIKVNDQVLEIEDGVTEYTITLDSDVASASIESLLKSDRFNFVDGNGPRTIEILEEGDNVIKIQVSNGDLTLLTYTININRGVKENSNTGTNYFWLFLIILIILIVAGIFISRHMKKNKSN